MSGVSVAKKNGGQTSAIFANDTRWRPNSQILHRRDRSNSRVTETARPSGMLIKTVANDCAYTVARKGRLGMIVCAGRESGHADDRISWWPSIASQMHAAMEYTHSIGTWNQGISRSADEGIKGLRTVLVGFVVTEHECAGDSISSPEAERLDVLLFTSTSVLWQQTQTDLSLARFVMIWL